MGKMLRSDFPEGLDLSRLNTFFKLARIEETIPAKCDWNFREDLKDVWYKEPHYWMPVTTLLFNPVERHVYGNTYQEEIPNWTICNRCYIVNRDRHYCEERVSSKYGSGPCGRQAKTEEDGEWYCGTHIPSVVNARRAERDRVMHAKIDASFERTRRQNEVNTAKNELVKLVRETQEWLEKSGLKDDDEWAKSLYRRFEKELGIING